MAWRLISLAARPKRRKTDIAFVGLPVTTYLMETETQTIYTLAELRENYERYIQDQNIDTSQGGAQLVDFVFWTADLVEVVPNRVDQPGYDPTCGDWRKA